MTDTPQGAALPPTHTETDEIWLAAACQDCRSWNRVVYWHVFNRRLCLACSDKWLEEYAAMRGKGKIA